MELLWKADVRMSPGPHSSVEHASLPVRKCVWKLQTDGKREGESSTLRSLLSPRRHSEDSNSHRCVLEAGESRAGILLAQQPGRLSRSHESLIDGASGSDRLMDPDLPRAKVKPIQTRENCSPGTYSTKLSVFL